jgi:hypothetical protein
MTDPGLIGIAGDWHGNTKWALHAIRRICERLHEESPKIILQAGDFGVWHPPGMEIWTFGGKEHSRLSYLSALDEVLFDNDAQLWFVDGNHEDHNMLAELAASQPGADSVWLTSRIKWLQRGHRWNWHRKTWLALGGAVSVDKLLRKEGVDWFPQEEITDAQEALIIAGGHADVLLCHDAPSCEPLSLMVPSAAWLPMIPRAEDHRERMERICRAVKPSQVFHGHYHLSRQQELAAPWGPCRFTALDRDGRMGNWGILDTRTMEWQWQQNASPGR